jgi:hypothetical protein
VTARERLIEWIDQLAADKTGRPDWEERRQLATLIDRVEAEVRAAVLAELDSMRFMDD